MQIVSNGDNLHEMSEPVFWGYKKKVSKCRLLKILARVLRVKNTIMKGKPMNYIWISAHDRIFSLKMSSATRKERMSLCAKNHGPDDSSCDIFQKVIFCLALKSLEGNLHFL